jgi:hypothetical protein
VWAVGPPHLNRTEAAFGSIRTRWSTGRPVGWAVPSPSERPVYSPIGDLQRVLSDSWLLNLPPRQPARLLGDVFFSTAIRMQVLQRARQPVGAGDEDDLPLGRWPAPRQLEQQGALELVHPGGHVTRQQQVAGLRPVHAEHAAVAGQPKRDQFHQRAHLGVRRQLGPDGGPALLPLVIAVVLPAGDPAVAAGEPHRPCGRAEGGGRGSQRFGLEDRSTCSSRLPPVRPA